MTIEEKAGQRNKMSIRSTDADFILFTNTHILEPVLLIIKFQVTFFAKIPILLSFFMIYFLFYVSSKQTEP